MHYINQASVDNIPIEYNSTAVLNVYFTSQSLATKVLFIKKRRRYQRDLQETVRFRQVIMAS